ncbi:uncharacterized protein TNCV_3539961 [Trichonephila clavipes]|nr:uncharacterized protein TNCV_3539961 [Trichonephila clavipes]
MVGGGWWKGWSPHYQGTIGTFSWKINIVLFKSCLKGAPFTSVEEVPTKTENLLNEPELLPAIAAPNAKVFDFEKLLSAEAVLTGFQECDEEDVETWMAYNAKKCGFQMLSADEIVTSVQEESDPVDEKTDEDEDHNKESSKGPSNADAFSAL